MPSYSSLPPCKKPFDYRSNIKWKSKLLPACFVFIRMMFIFGRYRCVVYLEFCTFHSTKNTYSYKSDVFSQLSISEKRCLLYTISWHVFLPGTACVTYSNSLKTYTSSVCLTRALNLMSVVVNHLIFDGSLNQFELIVFTVHV